MFTREQHTLCDPRASVRPAMARCRRRPARSSPGTSARARSAIRRSPQRSGQFALESAPRRPCGRARVAQPRGLATDLRAAQVAHDGDAPAASAHGSSACRDLRRSWNGSRAAARKTAPPATYLATRGSRSIKPCSCVEYAVPAGRTRACAGRCPRHRAPTCFSSSSRLPWSTNSFGTPSLRCGTPRGRSSPRRLAHRAAEPAGDHALLDGDDAPGGARQPADHAPPSTGAAKRAFTTVAETPCACEQLGRGEARAPPSCPARRSPRRRRRAAARPCRSARMRGSRSGMRLVGDRRARVAHRDRPLSRASAPPSSSMSRSSSPLRGCITTVPGDHAQVGRRRTRRAAARRRRPPVPRDPGTGRS